jgi:hypothetical protein
MFQRSSEFLITKKFWQVRDGFALELNYQEGQAPNLA